MAQSYHQIQCSFGRSLSLTFSTQEILTFQKSFDQTKKFGTKVCLLENCPPTLNPASTRVNFRVKIEVNIPRSFRLQLRQMFSQAFNAEFFNSKFSQRFLCFYTFCLKKLLEIYWSFNLRRFQNSLIRTIPLLVITTRTSLTYTHISRLNH